MRKLQRWTVRHYKDEKPCMIKHQDGKYIHRDDLLGWLREATNSDESMTDTIELRDLLDALYAIKEIPDWEGNWEDE